MIAFDVALTALAEAILNTTLRHQLNLSQKHLGDGDCSALQEVVKEGSTSTRLKLSLVSVAVIAPAKAFKHNSTKTQLNL